MTMHDDVGEAAADQDLNHQPIPEDEGNGGGEDDQKPNIYALYSSEEIENFRCIFEMFDKERQGFIGVPDLQTIMRSLGRDPNEAGELMTTLELTAANEDSDGRINFEDFLKLMKNLENRLVTGGGEGVMDNDEFSPREASLDERNKYGSLLPRTGVHFLPDPKVVDFLK